MSALPLTYAGILYDRTEPLWNGSVKPQGIDLNYLVFDHPPVIFDRMVANREFDSSEMGLSRHFEMSIKHPDDWPFVALPIFPSKVFRRAYIWINKKSGIKEPKDLEGRRVGMPAYGQTAAIWVRGLLANDHGVDMDAINWVVGGVYAPGGPRGTTVKGLTREVRVEPTPDDKTLSGMIADGEIDALIGANVPSTYGKHPDVVRLFPNSREVEQEYFAKSGVYPIMHNVAIRKDVVEDEPWVAHSLYDAFDAAKNKALGLMKADGACRYMLPWLDNDIDEINSAFGGDPWPSGVEANRATLETLMRYMAEQFIIDKPYPVDDFFLPVGKPH